MALEEAVPQLLQNRAEESPCVIINSDDVEILGEQDEADIEVILDPFQLPSPELKAQLKAIMVLPDPEANYVTAGAGPPNLAKAGGFEGLNKPHEPIAGRIRLHGVSLDNFGAFHFGELNRGLDKLFRQAAVTEPPDNKEADQGPDLLRIVCRVVDSTKITVCRTWRDGTPGNRLSLMIAEDANGNAFLNAPMQGSFSALAVGLPGLLRSGPPNHAPTMFWTTSAFEEFLQPGLCMKSA
jgi:hypothetical protein